jgi:AraC family transcriptional regulator
MVNMLNNQSNSAMNPEIRTLTEKKFVGKRLIMSFSKNRTKNLWQGFMPRRKEIRNNIGSDLYSLEVYAPLFFDEFSPVAEFEKWAAIEVTDFGTVPEGMETLVVPAGLYAVFMHKCPASEGPKTYQYIFGIWLPYSDFLIDNRPHFAVIGEKYKNEDQDSEEEIWIPVKPRASV